MKLERTGERIEPQALTEITITATAEASYMVTDEQLMQGGQTVEQQVDQQLMRAIKRDAMHSLGIDDDIEASLRILRDSIDSLVRTLDPLGKVPTTRALDAAFNAAVGRMKQ